MQIMGTGINYTTGALLVGLMDEQAFGRKLQESFQQVAEEMRTLTRASTSATTFRDEIERERTVDLNNPREAGWTFLVNGNDPQRTQIEETLRPLAEWRGMEDPTEPLIYQGESPDEWFDWLQDNYSSLLVEKIPHYVLIAGGPDQVPFHFQSLLDSAASVGRVDFDSPEDLKTYVEKVIRLEQAPSPVVTREAIFFAPDGGMGDATFFSRRYMAEPLADHVRTQCGFETQAMMGDDATKERLLESLRGATPPLVYTASHGVGAIGFSLEIQKQVNGAICCQHEPTEPVQQWLFTAADVPLDEPFLEGAIFFQFACFGYGTPAESDFEHWLGDPKLNAEADFVAALPKRLLAHPRGPVAFIGHVDTAWLHGFDDPDNPYLLERWHPRIAPFVKGVEKLLKTDSIGQAMVYMDKRYDIGNAQLTTTIDRLQRGTIQMTPDIRARLVSVFITRSDAQNYMIFGDPAVRLRIPTA